MVADRKAIRIEIEYDDGVVEFATGDAADEIMRWFGGCQTLASMHGARYEGAKLETRALISTDHAAALAEHDVKVVESVTQKFISELEGKLSVGIPELTAPLAAHDAQVIAAAIQNIFPPVPGGYIAGPEVPERERKARLEGQAEEHDYTCRACVRADTDGTKLFCLRRLQIMAALRAAAEPTEIHRPGQIPVNTPTCNKCGKMFLECQCSQAHIKG